MLLGAQFRQAFQAVVRLAYLTGCRKSEISSLQWRQVDWQGRVVRLHDFRRTAIRNLERAGVPRSAAMAMVDHKTEAIYRRCAIVDAAALREAAAKIDAAISLTGTILGTTKENRETRRGASLRNPQNS